MRRNFELSSVLAALGALIVLIALFFEWYEPGLSAWDAFEIVDWALIALAILALVSVAEDLRGRPGPSPRLPWVAGAIGLLVLSQLIDPPPVVAGAERAFGAWLALAGVLLLWGGVVLALLSISVRIHVAGRERRRRTSAVDARAGAREGDDDGDAAAPSSTEAVPGGGSALWKRPSGKSKGQVEGEPSPSDSGAADAAAVPAPDPDRTQPLSPSQRPDADG
ncbi:MAG TPA: hypothetical protein VIL49_17705 [Capillimicrobium sp.]|jgi:hypothetical protein